MALIPTPLRRLTLLLSLLPALLLTGAGCQSGRTAFQFRPSAPAPHPVAAVAATSAVPAPAEAARTPQGSPPSVSRPPSPAPSRAARRLAARPRLVRRLVALAAQSAPLPGLKPRLTSHYQRHRPALAPAGVAESGLGTTFLGILGIVLLVVGLIGLPFAGWGFFGWLAVGGAVALLISILAPSFGW